MIRSGSVIYAQAGGFLQQYALASLEADLAATRGIFVHSLAQQAKWGKSPPELASSRRNSLPDGCSSICLQSSLSVLHGPGSLRKDHGRTFRRLPLLLTFCAAAVTPEPLSPGDTMVSGPYQVASRPARGYAACEGVAEQHSTPLLDPQLHTTGGLWNCQLEVRLCKRWVGVVPAGPLIPESLRRRPQTNT